MSAKKQYPFAPGVIDGQPKVRHWMWTDFVGALALVAAAYFLVGYWR